MSEWREVFRSPCKVMVSALEIGLIWDSSRNRTVRFTLGSLMTQDHQTVLGIGFQAGWITRPWGSQSAMGLPELAWLVSRASHLRVIFSDQPYDDGSGRPTCLTTEQEGW